MKQVGPIIHFPPCCHRDCPLRKLIVKSVILSDFYVGQGTFHFYNFEPSGSIGFYHLLKVILYLSVFTGVRSMYLNKVHK